MSDTTIEWTDKVWNPVTGCTKVSQGCKNCYAERVFPRAYGKERKFTDVVCHEDRLGAPLHWRKPARIFVNSMSDLFHENVPAEFIVDVFEVMEAATQHTFQVLTKRPERIDPVLYGGEGNWYYGGGDYAANVHLGVSDEGDQHGRIDILRKIPAAVRWISFEPLIFNPGIVDLSGIDWVVCGGESGPSARPMHPDWARSLRDQCQAAGVPFFFKQWGEWMPIFHGINPSDNDPKCRVRDGSTFPPNVGEEHGQHMWRVGKKAAGRLLDGREWNEYPAQANR